MIKCTLCKQQASVISTFHQVKYCVDHLDTYKKSLELQPKYFSALVDIHDYLCELARLGFLHHLDDNPVSCIEPEALADTTIPMLLANWGRLWDYATSVNVDPHQYYPIENCIDIPRFARNFGATDAEAKELVEMYVRNVVEGTRSVLITAIASKMFDVTKINVSAEMYEAAKNRLFFSMYL